MHNFDSALRGGMANLMHDEEDDEDMQTFAMTEQKSSMLPSRASTGKVKAGFLQVSAGTPLQTRPSSQLSVDEFVNHMLQVSPVTSEQTRPSSQETLDDYVKESEKDLSAALGPRWEAGKIEKDADENTRKLLQGMGGSNIVRALNGIMGTMHFR